MVGPDVVIPDFDFIILQGADLDQVKNYIFSDLQRRRLENHYHPHRSSVASLNRMYPGCPVLHIPTQGWDNPGPLKGPDIPEE